MTLASTELTSVNFLVFRSGIPFAYVAFFAALLAMLAGGALVSVARLRAKPRRSVWLPMSAVVVVSLVLAVNVYVEQSMELNPQFTDIDLVGAWNDDAAVLTLRQNGEFSCVGSEACALLGESGTWTRHETFELAFRSTTGRVVIRRVVRRHARYYLTTMPDDPDLWDGKLTFQIRARAS